ncbi:MAG: D-alanyl-D-alanine carboxypeptidase/D-alanyl-D-alanine-endopeptidase [Ferruginibacter sp.]
MFQRIMVAVFSFVLISSAGFSQRPTGEMEAAIQALSKDTQFRHAITSFYVIDNKTGVVIFDKNSQLGLAPASCQKIITSVSAFELLGKGFQYKTYIGYDLTIDNGILAGNLYLTGRGDPTLGSDRWKSTSAQVILKRIVSILQKNNIQSVAGDLVADDSHFTMEPVPNGWVWEDIGNYYGAGAWGLNWKENQFDVTFRTGKNVNDPTQVISTNPVSLLTDYTFANFVKTGGKGSGDNGYLFSSPFQKNIIARGTVPISENGFTISGSLPDPPGTFIKRLNGFLNENRIIVNGSNWTNSGRQLNNQSTKMPTTQLDSILSPALDSINYWFLKKSVNLYGEAFIKMIAYQKTKSGSTDTGINIIKEFWSKHGIERSALNMIDGSGLSPANRITAHALVTALQYAKSRPWFPSFYNALPETNGIKMKDGYISGVRSYTGYFKSKKGGDYTFAFITNNFDGSAGTAREKIWKILALMDNL